MYNWEIFKEISDREMTIEETIAFLKKSVQNFKIGSLHTMDEIKEYKHMHLQLNNTVPLATYYTGSRREHAHKAAEDVILLDNFNRIKRLSDEELVREVVDEYLRSSNFSNTGNSDENINQYLTDRERMYIEEGIQKAKDFLDFDWVESVIEKYDLATITGEELCDLVQDGQKQLQIKETPFLEDLVAAGERLLFTVYSVPFYQTDALPLCEYVASAKQWRKEHWDFDLE